MPGHQWRWGRRIEAYVDGALPPQAVRPVARHLRGCWSCSEEAELLRMVKGSLRRGPRRVTSLELVRLHRFARQVAQGAAGR